MNVLQERIPMLIARALSYERDRAGDSVSLREAERRLQSLGVPREKSRWLHNKRATDIAAALYTATGDPDQVVRCIQACMGGECSTRAWIEMASAFRSALGLKWHDRAWDHQMRGYLSRACEFADDCADWCRCSTGWHISAQDDARARDCLAKAEMLARSFFDCLDCADAWIGQDDRKTLYWVERAALLAITPRDWLRCADTLWHCRREDPQTLAVMEDCMGRALEATRTHETYARWILLCDRHLGSRGADRVMSNLRMAERLIAGMDDWYRHVAAIILLIQQAERVHEPPPFGPHPLDELRTYQRECLEIFRRRRPGTEGWLELVRRIRWNQTDEPVRYFMAQAEAAAGCASDWHRCAAVWLDLKQPESRRRASLCRLRSLQAARAVVLP